MLLPTGADVRSESVQRRRRRRRLRVTGGNGRKDGGSDRHFQAPFRKPATKTSSGHYGARGCDGIPAGMSLDRYVSRVTIGISRL